MGMSNLYVKKKIMITKNNKIKCDECGHFISYKELQDEEAANCMILPDSDCSFETWESICKKCLMKTEVEL